LYISQTSTVPVPGFSVTGSIHLRSVHTPQQMRQEVSVLIHELIDRCRIERAAGI